MCYEKDSGVRISDYTGTLAIGHKNVNEDFVTFTYNGEEFMLPVVDAVRIKGCWAGPMWTAPVRELRKAKDAKAEI